MLNFTKFVNEQLHLTVYARFLELIGWHFTLRKLSTYYLPKNQDAKSTNLPLYLNNNNPNIDEEVQLKIPIARVHGTENGPAIKFLGIYIDPNNDFNPFTKAKNSYLNRDSAPQ